MPTMKYHQKYLKAVDSIEKRSGREDEECLALHKALKFSGINGIDHPVIEVVDILLTLKDPLMMM